MDGQLGHTSEGEASATGGGCVSRQRLRDAFKANGLAKLVLGNDNGNTTPEASHDEVAMLLEGDGDVELDELHRVVVDARDHAAQVLQDLLPSPQALRYATVGALRSATSKRPPLLARAVRAVCRCCSCHCPWRASRGSRARVAVDGAHA
jgi:hypothetical protein